MLKAGISGVQKAGAPSRDDLCSEEVASYTFCGIAQSL